MTLLDTLLTTIAAGADPGPFALLHREGSDDLEVFTGTAAPVGRLGAVPLPTAGAPGPRTLAVIPYRQISERGFACVDDGLPLECLVIDAAERVPLPAARSALPAGEIATAGGGFEIDDDAYARTVERVLAEEIGTGEGANFVIHRAFTAHLDGPPLAAAVRALRRLLVGERGAYWTFLVHTGGRTLVGASPERQVSVEDGLVMKNPISGTHRHGPAGADPDALLRFLADRKETDELYMVLDEELKMMATVADRGGQVVGPYVKEMAHLTHTEYLLAGRGSLDVRDVLRETMFAPTVTGSPIENACRVIARHEGTGRRYYSGAVALLGYDGAGRQSLDSAILIRTAELTADGRVRVPVGATMVRHSTPAGEVAETHAKAAGVLTALGLHPAAPARPADRPDRLADDPRIAAALAARNTDLARFWLAEREPDALHLPALVGRHVLIVDAEDSFTGMLAHVLRALGPRVTLRPYTGIGDLTGFDLVVVGPGPGDPRDGADAKMRALRRLVRDLLATRRPALGVCLGHQVLAAHLGLRMHRRTAPYQGLQRDVEMFGSTRRVGFYSTFTALADEDEVATGYGRVRLARDAGDGAVHALRGEFFAGVQFHPESVLSRDGVAVLSDLLPALLPATLPAP
ncbi:chorismate-binding protein [Rhizomonospora bruguierae]|uniref:chorismate-binding protein n=1 Tax=Rhizomonospora bruguierae TaxID=1581705 RepID=UPI001BD120D4|nr:chorismate-binding protein [Micromonospora sp. NBRC 107566]